MYLNGFYLILNILQVTHNDKDTWTLVIKNVRQKDGGEYMCQVNSVPMVSQVIWKRFHQGLFKSLQFYFYFWWMKLLQKFKNRSSSVQRDDMGVFIFFDSFSNNVIHQEVNGHVLYLGCVIYVSFIPYFRLLVFGILVTLVAWFSFLFSILPILPCKM